MRHGGLRKSPEGAPALSAKPRGKGETRWLIFSGSRLAIGIALALLGLAACRESGGEGELFQISGKLFVFNYRVATATYL